MHASAGGPGDHAIGVASADGPRGLGEGEQAGCFAVRQGVVRTAQIVVDRNVTGRHVRQVLQQPQRRHLAEAFAAPAVEFELPARISAKGDCVGVVRRHREHIVASEDHAGPFRRGVARDEAGVGQCFLSRGDAHLGFAAHQLDALSDRLLTRLVEFSEVVDVPRKLAGFGGVGAGEAGRGQLARLGHAAGTTDEGLPQGLERVAERRDETDSRDDDAASGSSGIHRAVNLPTAAIDSPGPGDVACPARN